MRALGRPICPICPAHLLALCALLALAAQGARGLRDVRLEAPRVVRAGGTAALACLYDLQGETLYTVKWYRGSREFFRFEPASQPPRRALPFPGLLVDLTASGPHEVVLRALPPQLSGAFSCEVSADAPSFTTAVATTSLTVTDFPELRIASDLLQGRLLSANCSYQPLPPPLRTSLAFYVNNRPAPASALVRAWSGGAMLQLRPGPDLVTPSGEVTLRCVLLVDGQFPLGSDTVTVRLPALLPPPPPTPPPPPPPPPPPLWPSLGARGSSGTRKSSIFLPLTCLLLLSN